MRIAVVAPPWLPVPPQRYGGTELVLDVLCRGLVEAGHDVLLHATGDSTCPVERSWTYDQHLGTDNVSPAAELHHVMDAYDRAHAWGADVVHDHTITGPVWAQGRGTVPVVTTNHGPFVPPLDAIYRRIAERVPLVAISHHQRSTARGIPVAAVIHHGVDLDAIEPSSVPGTYAVFLGRMNPDKGVHTAVEVARRAGVPLRIAAKMREPAEIAYFRDVIEPMLGGDVEYVGEVGGADKSALVRDAMCLLNPIAWPEPFGMVMIEALAHGTPVVAAPRGAAREIVRHGITGFLAEQVDGLVDGVLAATALDRSTCRWDAEQRFSMRRMAADHLELYESMLSDRRVLAEMELDLRGSGAIDAEGRPTPAGAP